MSLVLFRLMRPSGPAGSSALRQPDQAEVLPGEGSESLRWKLSAAETDS